MTRQAFCRVLVAFVAIAVLSGHSLPISSAIAQRLSDVWTWTLSTPVGLGSCQPLLGCDNVRIASLAAYNGQIFAGTENAMQGAEIWRYDGAAWSRQVQGGLGDAQNSGVVSMAPYAGLLYAGTQQGDTSGAELWAYNGITWTRALSGGFDQSVLPSDPKNIAATALAAFNGKLYIGTRYDYSGAEIWAYDGITVTQVVSTGLANTDNVAVLSLAVFSNKLYAGTLNLAGGAELWRSSNGSDWARVAAATGGFGDPTNVGISSLAVMSGTLYAGTQNLNSDGGTGADIWSSSDGVSFNLALGAGFGNSALFKVNSLLPFQGVLYAGVSNGDQPQAEVWSYNGQTWQRAMSSAPLANGQPHSFYEARSLASLNDALYLGTSQVSIGSAMSGPEVWRTGGPSAATPTATATAPTPSRTATATVTPVNTATPTATATGTRSPTATPTQTGATATPTRTVPASQTATNTVTATPTETPSPTPTARFMIFLPLILR